MTEKKKAIEAFKFQPGQSGNPNGRPRNRVPASLAIIFASKKRAKEFYALSGTEIDSWENAVLALSSSELQALMKWKDAPAYPKGLAIAILSDMRDGKTTTIDKLRERQHGKPSDRIEITGKDGKDLLATPEVDITTLTDEQRSVLLTIGLEIADRKE